MDRHLASSYVLALNLDLQLGALPYVSHELGREATPTSPCVTPAGVRIPTRPCVCQLWIDKVAPGWVARPGKQKKFLSSTTVIFFRMAGAPDIGF